MKYLLPNWEVRFLFQSRSCCLLTELNIIFLHVFNNNLYFENLQYFYVNKKKKLSLGGNYKSEAANYLIYFFYTLREYS